MADDPKLDLSVLAAGMLTAGRVWAIRPEVLQALCRFDGTMITSEQVETLARFGAAPAKQVGKVAVVPLKGMITPSGGLLAMLFGDTAGGLQGFRAGVQAAISNPDVESIVLDIDSPGGLVDQVPETAAWLKQQRDTSGKPIVAVANTLAASAAYWLASQAHEVAVTPSGEAGSIGVYQRHVDLSEAHAMDGVKPTLISAGKYKVEGNPYEPLGDEAANAMQQAVDDYYGMFIKGVADGRGIDDPQQVADGYGEGRVLTAKRAVQAGLADKVATLEQTVGRLASGRARVKQTADSQPGDRLTYDDAPSPRSLSRDEKLALMALAGC